MFDPAKVGEEVFGTLRSFDYAVAIFDDEGNKVYEPADARRFFTDKKNITVSLFEDGENSALHVYLGRSVDLSQVQVMLDTLRRCASKFGILFNVRKYRRELRPKDFANGTGTIQGDVDVSPQPTKVDTSGTKDEMLGKLGTEIKKVSQMLGDMQSDLREVKPDDKDGDLKESRKLTGSTKSSYLKLEGARMIIRHDSAVDDKKLGARGRNVRKVFVENAEGERFLMPTQNLMAGRAMTRHISKGGEFHDEVGGKLTTMAEQQQHMKACASYCRKNKKKLDESVMQIVEACTARAKNIRNVFEGLYRRYEKTLNEMKKETDTLLLETDDEMLEEKVEALKAKLQLEDDKVVDRSTCESVVRLLGESDLLEGRPANREMIPLKALRGDGEDAVLVEKDAWEAFKANPPVVRFIKSAPDLSSARNYSMALSMISHACADDGFSSMLAFVAQEFEDGKSDALLKNIAERAIKATKDSVGVEAKVAEGRLTSGLIVTESVADLDAWFESMSEDRIFEDDTGSRFAKSRWSDNDYEGAVDRAHDSVADDFNVDDFLVMNGGDFLYGEADMTAEDKNISAKLLISSLTGYLEGELQSEVQSDIETGDDDFGDVSAMAKHLLPQVVSRLESEGYTIDGLETLEGDEDGMSIDSNDSIQFDDSMLDESDDELDGDDDVEEDEVEPDGLDDKKQLLLSDEDLAHEDVLTPVNPAKDLKREVAAPLADKKDDEDYEGYINRLRTLAGVRGNR